VNAGVLEVIFDAKSSRQMAGQLADLPAATELACLQCFPNGLAFYLRRTATLISRNGSEVDQQLYRPRAEAGTPVWPKQIVSLADFDAWLASRKTPVLLIARQQDRGKLESIATARGAIIQPLSQGYWSAQFPVPRLLICVVFAAIVLRDLLFPRPLTSRGARCSNRLAPWSERGRPGVRRVRGFGAHPTCDPRLGRRRTAMA